MAVCLLASIGLEGDDVVYLGPDGAQWRVPLNDVRLIGLFAADEGRALAFVTDPEAAWFQATCSAVGADRLLSELSARLGSSMQDAMISDVSTQGRVVWPPQHAGEELFEARTAARKTATPQLRAELRASIAST
jgi:hypothetical protein